MSFPILLIQLFQYNLSAASYFAVIAIIGHVILKCAVKYISTCIYLNTKCCIALYL